MSEYGPYVEMDVRADGSRLVRQQWPKRIRPADWPATQFLLSTCHPGPLTDEEAAAVRAAAERNYLQMHEQKLGRGPPAAESDPWLRLVQEQEGSFHFQRLARRTQDLYGRMHELILRDWRDRPELSPRRVTDPQIEKHIQALGLCDFDSRHFLTALRFLLKRAVAEELRPPHMKMSVSMGDKLETQVRLWEAADVEYVADFLEQRGLVGMADFVQTMWCLGQRMADVRMFKYDHHYTDGHFWFRTRKTNELVLLEAPERLARRLDANYAPGGYLFTTRAGEPWTALKLANSFQYMRSQMAPYAGQLLQMQHLRHSAVTDLALSGCTIPEIASVTRHKLRSVHRILEVYLANHPLLARSAQFKREERRLHGASGELLVEGERRIFIGQLPPPQKPREPSRRGEATRRELAKRPYWSPQKALADASGD